MRIQLFGRGVFYLLTGLLGFLLHAQDSITIVNNSTATADSTVTFGVEDLMVAQGFKTPNNGQNYRLDSVTLYGLSDYPAGTPFTTTFDVLLSGADSQGLPADNLGVINRETLPTDVSSLTAIPSGNLMLLNNTSYYVVLVPILSASESPEMSWSLTASTESSGLGALGQYARYTSAPTLNPWIAVPGNTGLLSVSASPVAVPEPSSLSLSSCCAFGLLLIGAVFKRKASGA